MIFSNLRKILSLCMIGAIAATITGFSETPKTEVAPVVPAVAGTTLPVQRTLTSADGRKLDVTIFAKSATAIQARRTSDAKEFELEITKLSIEDKAFVAGLVTTPIKKPTVLLITKNNKIQALLEKAGFEITVPLIEKRAVGVIR